MPGYLCGIDIGGTFTDCVVVDESGTVVTTKAPSTPHDFSLGMMAALEESALKLGLSLPDLCRSIVRLSHGTTVGTNTIIQHRGARVGLITTRGHNDVIHMMRGSRGITGRDIRRVIFLATTAINNYNLVSTFPVRKVEDLKGRKIAAAGPNLPWVSAVGAIPVQGNLNEAYTSLQSGLYEGWVMFVDGTWGFKLYEVARHYTFTNFGAIVVGAITVNKDTWGKLPDEVRAVLKEVSEEYGVKQVEAGLKKQERGLEAMKQAGTTFYSPPFAEIQKWANALPNIPQQKADEADAKGLPGSAVIRGYIEGLEADGFKFPRRWPVR